MSYKVTTAKLHTSYFPGMTGNLGDKLDPAQLHRGMTLTYTSEGLFGCYKGVHFVIPLANVVGVTLAADPFPVSTAVSKIA